MSESILQPTELVRELASRMKAKNLNPNLSKPWTIALKNCLREMLESKGEHVTDVLYSDREGDTHEFLLDVVVWSRSNGEGVVLAVESEWLQNVAAIEEDFWKLLVIKAPIKLMIFACNGKPRVHTQEAIWDRLSTCLKNYRDHCEGEQYVFMDYAPGLARKAWSITIPENGKLPSVPERQIISFE